ncbi:MAG: DUF1467 family protein [Rhodobacteraceae bacterium]|nr:DUF1467 family protein [Paracoccaceae bacterium]
MAITSALVLFSVIWFMVLFVVLPLRLETQGDRGEVTPGTQAGAPAELNLGRKFRIVTAVAVVLWAIIAGIIVSGAITICDVDWLSRTDCAATKG